MHISNISNISKTDPCVPLLSLLLTLAACNTTNEASNKHQLYDDVPASTDNRASDGAKASGIDNPGNGTHPEASAAAGMPGRELLLAYELKGQLLEVRVYTGGCTKQEHFRLQVQESQPPQFTVVRDVADRCRAYLPKGTIISFDLTPYYNGGEELRLTNQVMSQAVTP